jgi:hypothetical protein
VRDFYITTGSLIRLLKFHLHWVYTAISSADGTEGKPPQIIGAWRSGRGPGAPLCCTYFCLSRYYHYLSTAQINPRRPNPSHSATDSLSFPLSVEIFNRPALAWGPKIFFHPAPNPLSAALGVSFMNTASGAFVFLPYSYNTVRNCRWWCRQYRLP